MFRSYTDLNLRPLQVGDFMTIRYDNINNSYMVVLPPHINQHGHLIVNSQYMPSDPARTTKLFVHNLKFDNKTNQWKPLGMFNNPNVKVTFTRGQ